MQLLVTLRLPATTAILPGPSMAHFVGPLTALEAEELLVTLAPTLRYPELVDLATICGYAPLMLSVVAGAVKKQKLSTQVSSCVAMW